MNIKLRAYLKIKKIKQNCLITLSRISSKKKKKNFTKFIILSRSRSGSNLLVSFLESHPNIYIRGEIFHNLNNRDYRKVLNWFFDVMPSKFKASGFKIFYYHPLDTKCPELWRELTSNKDLKIIHLHRENLIKTIISRQIALKTDVWSSEKKDRYSSYNFEIPPKKIENEIKRTLTWRNEFGKMFENHDILELSYEDFINAKSHKLFIIQDFLGVSQMKLKSHLKKQQKKPLSKIIKNYDEIERYFNGTNWKKYF